LKIGGAYIKLHLVRLDTKPSRCHLRGCRGCSDKWQGSERGAESPGNNIDLWNRTPIPFVAIIEPMIFVMERGWIKTLRDNLYLHTNYRDKYPQPSWSSWTALPRLSLQRSVRPSARSVDEFPIESYVNRGSLLKWHRKLEVFPLS
jgi:hypothetical protein